MFEGFPSRETSLPLRTSSPLLLQGEGCSPGRPSYQAPGCLLFHPQCLATVAQPLGWLWGRHFLYGAPSALSSPPDSCKRSRLEQKLPSPQPLPAHLPGVGLSSGLVPGLGLAANGQNFSSLGLPPPCTAHLVRQGKWLLL